MIFKPVLARAVAAGRKTQTRQPVRPGEEACRYREGRTYAVQPGRGKPGICRIEIVHVAEQQLGALTFPDARAEGFRTRDEFFDYWQALYGSAPDPAQLVWAIAFRLEAYPPRLLHKDSSHGYTTDPRLALPDEPEAVDERTAARFASQASVVTGLLQDQAASDLLQADRAVLEDQLAQLRAIARRRNVNVEADLRVITRRLQAIEAKIAKAAA